MKKQKKIEFEFSRIFMEFQFEISCTFWRTRKNAGKFKFHEFSVLNITKFFANFLKLRFFSYHQKVPYDPPELVLSDKTYGLVSPEPYEWPERAPLWTAAAYAAFDVALDPDSKEGKAKAVRIFLRFFSTFFSNSWFFFSEIRSERRRWIETRERGAT